ncbi:DNA polymerase III subunit alpha [Bacillus sp. CGMCC 1.16607]|uniref:DNA polymerase III subunit alpha n=1 Tax=Bacillus sp. CGMCC 1.16607 TaxID=3351842 RepID=UPI003644F5C1
MSFIHLHVYSAYSLLSSTIQIEKLVSEAKAKGFPALALTDRNVMYGTITFYKECLKHGIKPILGLTADVLNEEDESFPFVFLAKNEQGFQNLLKISSVIKTKSPLGIPIKWLKHYHEGLIVLSPGLEGEIEFHLLNDKIEKAKETVNYYINIFGKSNFYLSLQNHQSEKEEMIHNKLLSLANSTGIKLVATNQVFYLQQKDAFAHECLLAIKNGDKLRDDHREKLESDQYYFKSSSEMVELLSKFPDAIKNTARIASECNVALTLNQKHLPKFPIDENKTADQLLEEICKQGLLFRDDKPSQMYWDRLNYELQIIKNMKFSDYFLIVWDFMRFARENDILTGPGRGSAAGSLVAYVLQITDVDPIEHELLFERFLNPERISMPDIDIDFPDHSRDSVIQYVAQKYGEMHVAQIVTFGTLAAKASLRDVGRAFGFNPKELDQLSKLIPNQMGISLHAALQGSEGLRAFIGENPLHEQLFQTALTLEGLPRHTSTHAAGVVISEEPLVHVIPIQNGHGNVFLTQYAMEHLEDIGLLKMDFLGLRNLSLIETILKNIKISTRDKVDIKQIPLDDQATFELLSSGETTGIFQLESEGMRKVLMKLKPSTFEDIVAVNALYRPGPMENIPLFIDRKHGLKPIEYPHPDLEPILKKTYGIIVYQEQIMQIASKLAGFSLGEADLLRRAVGKKKKEILDQEREHFVSGAIQKGYSQTVANEIYDLILKFANYGFPRSHAVAYSIISYQLAYLKARYPLFFMSALLTSAIGNDSKIAGYIREVKQMKMNVLPPSINKSGYSFHVENGAIRYSLASIKGIGATVLKEIFQKRKQKQYEDLFDFCIRVSTKIVNKKAIEMLIYAGSFDEFKMDRAVYLASLDVAIEHSQLVNPNNSEQIDFFSDEGFFLKPKYVEVEAQSIEEKLKLEREALGIYLSNHPVSVYENDLFHFGAVPLLAMNEVSKLISVGVYINEVKKIRTKKGEEMAFLTVSDSSGEMEAVVFPTVFKKSVLLLKQGGIMVIEGKVERRSEANQMIIQKITEMNEWLKGKEKSKSTLFLKLEKDKQTSESLQKLKALLKENRGLVGIILFYEGTKKTVKLEDVFHINPTKQLINQLKDFLGEQNVILKE